MPEDFFIPTTDSFSIRRGDDDGWTLTISFSPESYARLVKDPRFTDLLMQYVALFSPRAPGGSS